jgi:heme-degrading monooxygenase HmoA
MTSRTTLARVARTPRPPYYAVTTTAELAAGYDPARHLGLGAKLHALASAMDGFLGLEVFFDGAASIAVSYWVDLAAVERWRAHPLHRDAKAIARAEWFGATITRIARVEDDYGFHLDEP